MAPERVMTHVYQTITTAQPHSSLHKGAVQKSPSYTWVIARSATPHLHEQLLSALIEL